VHIKGQYILFHIIGTPGRSDRGLEAEAAVRLSLGLSDRLSIDREVHQSNRRGERELSGHARPRKVSCHTVLSDPKPNAWGSCRPPHQPRATIDQHLAWPDIGVARQRQVHLPINANIQEKGTTLGRQVQFKAAWPSTQTLAPEQRTSQLGTISKNPRDPVL
jgi:hypothetical protein